MLSPVSLTLVLAALRGNAWRDEVFAQEINNAFGWGTRLPLSIPARQLLAAFQEPAKGKPCYRLAPPLKSGCFTYVPEGTWITNTLLYRSTKTTKGPIDERFALDASNNFRFKFVNTGNSPPTREDLRRERKSMGVLPDMSPREKSGPDDVWISSGTHIQTAWRGNTFSMSTPHPGEFQTASGQVKQVELIDSEMEQYLHAKTDTFEGVALPCNSGYMIVVLPVLGKDIRELERKLADHPESLDAALQKQQGNVTMPTFHISFESDLNEPIKALGINGVFNDLGHLIKVPKSHLTKLAQRVDLEVDKNGIRADAETVAGAVLGGIMSVERPFHMVLNRPFAFLIRDQTTNALLFIGAVYGSPPEIKLR